MSVKGGKGYLKWIQRKGVGFEGNIRFTPILIVVLENLTKRIKEIFG